MRVPLGDGPGLCATGKAHHGSQDAAAIGRLPLLHDFQPHIGAEGLPPLDRAVDGDAHVRPVRGEEPPTLGATGLHDHRIPVGSRSSPRRRSRIVYRLPDP